MTKEKKNFQLVIASLSVKGQLIENASLSNYTSWRTGGCAEYIFIPKDLSDLSQFLKQLPVSLPITYLGLGSNTLVRDKGLEGVVIITQGVLNKIESTGSHMRAEAGVASAKLARHTARLGMTGLEFLAGIPGTIGGALAMNAGCNGSETWKWVVSLETINRFGEIKHRPIHDFKVGYRHVMRPSDEWFVAGHFELSAGNKDSSLEQIRLLLEKRNLTQPAGTANCGSVFRNPSGCFAGQLIEQCGLKGKKIGGARVSHKHANFIINESGASSNDIESLIEEIKKIVTDQTGISLIPEVCIIGKN